MPMSPINRSARTSVLDDLDRADLSSLVEMDVEGVVVHPQSTPHTQIVCEKSIAPALAAIDFRTFIRTEQSDHRRPRRPLLQQHPAQVFGHGTTGIVPLPVVGMGEPHASIEGPSRE